MKKVLNCYKNNNGYNFEYTKFSVIDFVLSNRNLLVSRGYRKIIETPAFCHNFKLNLTFFPVRYENVASLNHL